MSENQAEGQWSDGAGSAPAPPPGGYPPPVGVAPRTNGGAVASLVLGILSIVLCPPVGIVGLILGITSRRKIRESNGRETGDGLAVGGIVTSLVGLVVIGLVVTAIFAVAFLGTAASERFETVGDSIGSVDSFGDPYEDPFYDPPTERFEEVGDAISSAGN